MFTKLHSLLAIVTAAGLCASMGAGRTLAAWPRHTIDDTSRESQNGSERFVSVGRSTASRGCLGSRLDLAENLIHPPGKGTVALANQVRIVPYGG